MPRRSPSSEEIHERALETWRTRRRGAVFSFLSTLVVLGAVAGLTEIWWLMLFALLPLLNVVRVASSRDETVRAEVRRIEKKQARQFQNLGRAYLRGRVNLKRAYLLIDARHGLKSVDDEALDALDLAAVSYQVVLTKADKLRSRAAVEDLAAKTAEAIKKRPAAFPRVAVTSSETGAGVPELRAEIARACET